MIKTIKTDRDLREMLTEVISNLGWAFHPDDSMAEYVRRDTGEPFYTPEEAEKLDTFMDEAFAFCEQNGIDIYELSMQISKKLHDDIFAE